MARQYRSPDRSRLAPSHGFASETGAVGRSARPPADQSRVLRSAARSAARPARDRHRRPGGFVAGARGDRRRATAGLTRAFLPALPAGVPHMARPVWATLIGVL